jgi:SAM-dependent methyltransferase
LRYADHIRSLFPTLDPVVGDLFLLESHQIETLPERAPAAELAAVLHAHPQIRRYLVIRHPAIETYLDDLLAAHPALEGPELEAAQDELVWEIGDLIGYQKAPDLYDARVADDDWALTAITDVAPIDGARVIDAGAGTGRVAFRLAPSARHVYAVEPASGMRGFMRQKATRLDVANLFVLDGTLDAVPLPAGSADLLVTCRAIGWHLDDELVEIERVVAPGGAAVHLTGMADSDWAADDWHATLIRAGYTSGTYRDRETLARRYWRRF